MTPRKKRSPTIVRTLIAKQKGRCGCGCGKPIAGPTILEHIVPLWANGSNDEDNLAVLLLGCADKKTRREAGERARADRAAAHHAGMSGSKRKIQSRGFPKSNRRKAVWLRDAEGEPLERPALPIHR